MSSDEPVGRSHCRSCGGHVSAEFARVFGDQANEVYACLACARNGALVDGAAAEPNGGDGQ